MNKKNVAIDYLRAFITLLVLAHHSFIAYAKFAPSVTTAFSTEPYVWSSLPVVDSQRWAGFDTFILFNDTFFMSLMFLLAGLFVFPSIVRKGHKGYLLGRLLRLGLPFVAVSVFLSPLAYYPSYLLSGSDPGLVAFLQQWYSLAYRPPGPVWFVAVLLALDVLVVLLHRVAPRTMESLAAISSGTSDRSSRFLLGLTGISIIAYVTMVFTFGPTRWFTLGPFMVQASRVLLYPTFFLAGVGIGARGIERGLLAHDGDLARRWVMWLGATVVSFALFGFFFTKILIVGTASSLGVIGMASFARVITCASTSFFLLAVFVRFANRRISILASAQMPTAFIWFTMSSSLGSNMNCWRPTCLQLRKGRRYSSSHCC